jgi:hypothetical protein
MKEKYSILRSYLNVWSSAPVELKRMQCLKAVFKMFWWNLFFGGSSQCTPCPDETYSLEHIQKKDNNYVYQIYSEEGSTSCLSCPSGTYSSLNSSECIVRPNGTASHVTSVESEGECLKCPGGTYSSVINIERINGRMYYLWF